MEYLLNEYILSLPLSAALEESIQAVKKNFAAQYEAENATAGKASITILRFQQYEMAEPRFMPRLKSVLASEAPLFIELEGFGSLPTHTIYVDIQTKNGLKALLRRLTAVRAQITPDKTHKPHFITDPYVSLARKLLPWQYEKGWLEMQHTPFSGKCVLSSAKLLRKKPSDAFYQSLAVFPLAGEPVLQHTQGTLFF